MERFAVCRGEKNGYDGGGIFFPRFLQQGKAYSEAVIRPGNKTEEEEMKNVIMRALCLSIVLMTAPAAADTLPELPAYSLDLAQTSVSGISSGAFMAVQFGTAHSAKVIGVAATAGGPYYCAHDSSLLAMRKCMQGDPNPLLSALPISDLDIRRMQDAARDWSRRGWIDDIDNLAYQRIWAFHGYNDGIVKKPVSDALQQWYAPFVPAAQRFYKDNIRATHGQITAGCIAGQGNACSLCATVGAAFINVCQDHPATDVYDAAGSALQLFYGPLRRTPREDMRGRLLEFEQTPYIFDRDPLLRRDVPLRPAEAGMAEKGYLYVPADCADGQACRLHIAFHGCQQYAERIGTAFVDYAGFNEWADANRLIVLYPQAVATNPSPLLPAGLPMNPEGCWDWWGYTFDMARHRNGQYATRDGVQIAAIWRMAQRLGGEGAAGPVVRPVTVPLLKVIDRSASQVALAWITVAEAAGYRLYRDDGAGTPLRRLTRELLIATAYVDQELRPQTRYRYELRAVDAAGNENTASSRVEVVTGVIAPPCDPYFSMLKGRPVDRFGRPTDKECP